jgi:uncharacterized DUF497 family protein
MACDFCGDEFTYPDRNGVQRCEAYDVHAENEHEKRQQHGQERWGLVAERRCGDLVAYEQYQHLQRITAARQAAFLSAGGIFADYIWYQQSQRDDYNNHRRNAAGHERDLRAEYLNLAAGPLHVADVIQNIAGCYHLRKSQNPKIK